MLEQIQHIDPSKITDLGECQKVLLLCMNIIEQQAQQLELQALEIQALKDEINRMKGEHGGSPNKPKHSHAGVKRQRLNLNASATKKRVRKQR